MSLDFMLVGKRLHTHPSFEECNVDDAKEVEHVDAETAAAMLAKGMVQACEHCAPDPAAQLDTQAPNNHGPDQ